MSDTTLRVVRVIKDVDLRKIHKGRLRYSRNIYAGEAVLLLNRVRDKCRLIDCMGGVHNYYSDDGYVFDAALLQEYVAAFRLRVILSGQKVVAVIGGRKAA